MRVLWVHLLTLHVNLDQARRRNLIEHEAVGIDQKLMRIARNRCGKFGADVREDQIAPTIQSDQTIASSQTDAQCPFVRMKLSGGWGHRSQGRSLCWVGSKRLRLSGLVLYAKLIVGLH